MGDQQQPSPITERVLLLDAIRGFALLGVLLVHTNHLAVSITGAAGDSTLLINNRLDLWVERFVRIFADEKAQTIFAAMFGISFVIQFDRFKFRFANPVSIYCRRLLGLLVIGLLHSLLLPTWDVLVYFAIGGFVLLLVRDWNQRTLVTIGLALTLTVMPTAEMMGIFNTGVADPEAFGKPALFQNGTYLEILQIHWPTVWYLDHLVRGLMTIQLYVLGRFMLGVVIIRSGLVTGMPLRSITLKRVAVIGFLAGFLLTESVWMARWIENGGWGGGNPALWHAVTLYLEQTGTLVFALSYVALFTLAWQSTLWHRFLLAFVPMGQMGLTNYILQSVFISLTYFGFGFGLLGHLGATWCGLLSLLYFLVLGLLSKAWMGRFHYGPFEWIWRAWTYNKYPSFRRVKRDN